MPEGSRYNSFCFITLFENYCLYDSANGLDSGLGVAIDDVDGSLARFGLASHFGFFCARGGGPPSDSSEVIRPRFFKLLA